MFISHILYRVHDLLKSVSRLEDAGFIVDVSKDAEKPYHAIIWFPEGPYLEIIKAEDAPPIDPELLKIEGNDLFVKRWEKWAPKEQCWCDFAIESRAKDLNLESEILKKYAFRFKMHQTDIKFSQGTQSWQNITTEDMNFPFLVSAYAMDPRPYKNTDHPNGVKGVEQMILGTDGLNLDLFHELVTEDRWYSLTAGKGIQTVVLRDSKLRFEDILK